MNKFEKFLFKKIEVWVVLIFLLLFFFITIFYGHLVFDHYHNNKIFKNKFHRYLVWSSEIPTKLKKYFDYKDSFEGISYGTPQGKSLNYNKKPRFKRYAPAKKNNELLAMSIYDFKKGHGVVNIIDLNNFKEIFSYDHDPLKYRDNIKNFKEFNISRLKDSATKGRTFYNHPLILENGDMIAHNWGLLFRINLCGELVWINDDDEYGHSIMQDYEGNIWVGSDKKPYSKIVMEKLPLYNEYHEGAINKIDVNSGKTLFSKSIAEIMIENSIGGDDIFGSEDPFHDNDIEPVLYDSEFFKKGDLFISIRNKDLIIQYDYKKNKVLRSIRGPFSGFHDPDVISSEEISIFNNNQVPNTKEFSEILIYNLKTNKFKKIHNEVLKSLNFKSFNNGLADFSKKGSILIEETNGGRLIFFNSDGLEWEFINIDENNEKRPVYAIFWSRLITDESLVEKLKYEYKNFKKEKCINY